jgi:hypothetical protein
MTTSKKFLFTLFGTFISCVCTYVDVQPFMHLKLGDMMFSDFVGLLPDFIATTIIGTCTVHQFIKLGD